MASSAFQRRFLLGPLLALALLGPAGELSGSGGPASPAATASPTPTTPAGTASAALLDALEAEQVYWVDHLVFAAAQGGELEELRALDPSVAWGTTVIVEVPATEGEDNLVVVIRAPIPGGGSLCVSEVTSEQDAGIWYARVEGDSKCPKARRGMRGWSPSESAWGL